MTTAWTPTRLVGDVVDHADHALTYLPLVLLSATVWALTVFVSRALSPLIAPKTYAGLSAGDRLDWDVRVVSTLFSIYVTVMALPNLADAELLANPMWSAKSSAMTLYAVATGYFLFDIVLCATCYSYYGAAFLAHGIACFFVYLFALFPVLTYYGAVFLLFEISTIFNNTRWFIDQVGMGSSLLAVANGIVLVLTFGTFRIAFGLYQSYFVLGSLLDNPDGRIPRLFVAYYIVSNIFLNTLNLYWFVKLVQGFVKRVRLVFAKATAASASSLSNEKDAVRKKGNVRRPAAKVPKAAD